MTHPELQIPDAQPEPGHRQAEASVRPPPLRLVVDSDGAPAAHRAASRRWSSRRQLAFLVLSSLILWAAAILGVWMLIRLLGR